MPLPTFDPAEGLPAARRDAFDEPDTEPDKAAFYISCPACGLDGWDGAFAAWPGRSYDAPSQIVQAVERLAAAEKRRKCPRCHAMASLQGLRLFVMSGSQHRDLVAEHDTTTATTHFFLVDPRGRVGKGPPDGHALRTACLDSCLRAGIFLSGVPDRRQDARRLLEAVALARPRDPRAHLALARLLTDAGESPAGLEHLRIAARHAGRHLPSAVALAQVLGDLALEHEDTDLFHQAMTWYERVLDRRPNDLAVHLAAGRLLVQTGNLDEGIPHLERAASDEELAAEAIWWTGVARLHQRRNTDAIAIFQRLAGHDVADPALFHMLALALTREGRGTEAEEALARAERLAPGHEETPSFRKLVQDALAGIIRDP